MGDLIVVAGALLGVLVIIAGIGWLVPALRHRITGQRTDASAGPLPGVGLVVGGLVVAALSLGVFSDGADASAGDVAATCDLLEGAEDEITVESLEQILAVAPDEIVASVQTVRDRFAAVGAAAFDEPAVGTAFETVGAFEAKECSA